MLLAGLQASALLLAGYLVWMRKQPKLIAVQVFVAGLALASAIEIGVRVVGIGEGTLLSNAFLFLMQTSMKVGGCCAGAIRNRRIKRLNLLLGVRTCVQTPSLAGYRDVVIRIRLVSACIPGSAQATGQPCTCMGILTLLESATPTPAFQRF